MWYQLNSFLFYFACLFVFLFVCFLYVVTFRVELNTCLCCNKEVWLFTPLHRIWTFVSFECLLSTLWSNLCCQCGHRIHISINQWREKRISERINVELITWIKQMDGQIARADQWIGALFKWCRKYIIEWLINLMVCIHHIFSFSVTKLY